MKTEELQIGKIYHFEFGGNTEVVGMVKEVKTMDIDFFFHHHYWNGYETFHNNGYCTRSAISDIKEASKSEKHNLFKSALDNNSI